MHEHDDGIPFGLPPITPQAAMRIALSIRDDELREQEEADDDQKAA